MVTCQYCGAKNPQGASFCDGCGAALTANVAAQAQATAQAQLAAAQAARAQATAKQSAVHVNHTYGTGRLPPQTMLNKRYLILRPIGRGGMAAVYQATDTRGKGIVAIKEMGQDELAPDELQEALASFKREAELLQNLKHPNLPRIYANFRENGRNYLVMDFVDGETLEQKLLARKGPLPEAQVLEWARQLCDVLGYLHRHTPPIIFRDLKPANVMVTTRGEVKLIDFGIARYFNARQGHDTQALGTPGYAPPEQYGSTQTDPRADIYALGATLYHLLTNYDVGKTPFALPPLRTRNSAVSQRTADAITRATQLRREDRYPDVGAFARDLGVAGKMKPPRPQARPQPTQQQQAQRPTQQQRVRATAGAAPGGAGAPGAATGSKLAGAAAQAASAVTAGAIAAGQAYFQSKQSPKAGAPTAGDLFQIAFRAAARTATGRGVTPVVQPRELDLGPLRAGQDGSATLTISGQNGAAVAGTLSPLASWIQLDKSQFSGISTLVQVTARTSKISGVGPQRGNIEVALGSQRMYIPVRLEVVAAAGAGRAKPSPPPNPAPYRPPNPQPAQPQANYAGNPPGNPAGKYAYAQPGAGVGAAAQQQAGQQAGQQAAGYPAQPRPWRTSMARVGQSSAQAGWRLALSMALALLLAFGLPLLLNAVALPQLTAQLPSPVWAAWVLLASGILGALVGAPLAYLGATRSPGLLRCSALVAGVGALLAASSSAQTHLTPAWSGLLPGAAELGSIALLLPLFVAVGAAVGAQPMVSRGLLAIARYIASHYRLVLATAVIAGGWIGLTTAQVALSAIFQQTSLALSLLSGCGLAVGVALGLLLAKPLGYLVRRFAFG